MRKDATYKTALLPEQVRFVSRPITTATAARACAIFAATSGGSPRISRTSPEEMKRRMEKMAVHAKNSCGRSALQTVRLSPSNRAGFS